MHVLQGAERADAHGAFLLGEGSGTRGAGGHRSLLQFIPPPSPPPSPSPPSPSPPPFPSPPPPDPTCPGSFIDPACTNCNANCDDRFSCPDNPLTPNCAYYGACCDNPTINNGCQGFVRPASLQGPCSFPHMHALLLLQMLLSLAAPPFWDAQAVPHGPLETVTPPGAHQSKSSDGDHLMMLSICPGAPSVGNRSPFGRPCGLSLAVLGGSHWGGRRLSHKTLFSKEPTLNKRGGGVS